MEAIQRLTHHRLSSISSTGEISRKNFNRVPWRRENSVNNSRYVRKCSSSSSYGGLIRGAFAIDSDSTGSNRRDRNRRSYVAARAGWFLGLGGKQQVLPEIVKAGDPVLHEPAQEVPPEEIESERIQKIIDDMIKVMRKAPGVGLAAPQIGVPLKVCEIFSFSSSLISCLSFPHYSANVRCSNVKY